MNYENIKIFIEDKIALITIDRPESLNALNAAVFNELDAMLDNLEDNRDVKCLIITGSGNKAFVAGADIKEFSSFKPQQAEQLSRRGQLVFDKIENYKKPIIAAINGFALGGGLELALSCHIRFASDNARLGLPEVTLGLIPGYGGTQRLPKLVGKGIANEIIFTASMISAERAKYIGLVNEVFSLDELIEKSTAVASAIVRNSSQAISRAICAVNYSENVDGQEKESKLFGDLFKEEDFQEGVSAFIEKRKPLFN